MEHEGRLEEAEKLHQRALIYYEHVLGLQHFRTLTTLDNLGVTFRDQGKYDEAEATQLRALSGYLELFGQEHADTLTCMANLAGTRWAGGARDEASALGRLVEEYLI